MYAQACFNKIPLPRATKVIPIIDYTNNYKICSVNDCTIRFAASRKNAIKRKQKCINIRDHKSCLRRGTRLIAHIRAK